MLPVSLKIKGEPVTVSTRNSTVLSVAIATTASLLVSLAGGTDAIQWAGLPITVWAAIIAFGINWLAFVPSYFGTTERYYDLVGTVSYLSVIVFIWLSGERETRATILALMIAIWTIRLGSFLFARVSADGRDLRFNKLKVNPWLFFRTWTLQAAWVAIASSAAVAAMSIASSAAIGFVDVVGLSAWSLGFIIEAVADTQKRQFRSIESNRDRFITTGLWAWSRHPNYFGEILLWTGISIVAVSDLSGWQLVTLVSPVLVWFLLTRISGIQLLERRGRKNWGEDPEYLAYVERTPALVPRPPVSGR